MTIGKAKEAERGQHEHCEYRVENIHCSELHGRASRPTSGLLAHASGAPLADNRRSIADFTLQTYRAVQLKLQALRRPSLPYNSSDVPLKCPHAPVRGEILPRKITANVRGVATFAALTINTVVWFVPLILLAVLKLVLPFPRARVATTRWLMALGENWVSGNALILGLNHDDRLDARGLDNLNRRGWYLVIANHQTWSDILILQTAFNRRIPFLKFFIKQELIWFPLLGMAWWALDMPFMKRYSKSYLAKHPEKKGQDLKATREACRKFSETPTSVINFVEGTRFSPGKKERRGSPYDNLLPPRAGGIALALSSMGSMFDAILDVTVVYPQGVVSFWDICRGDRRPVVVDVVKRPVEEWLLQGDYAQDREYRSAFHRWLTRIWSEKDARIDALRTDTEPRESRARGADFA